LIFIIIKLYLNCSEFFNSLFINKEYNSFSNLREVFIQVSKNRISSSGRLGQFLRGHQTYRLLDDLNLIRIPEPTLKMNSINL
jgi:hypothetical protein